MRNGRAELVLRFSFVLFVAAIGLGSIERWGHYRGLNGLVPCAALCLIAGVIGRNWLLVHLSAAVAAVYVFLSWITIAQ